jgi:hypothetical protein
LTVC